MHHHPFSSEILHEAGIERFVSVQDQHYNDIRMMHQQVLANESSLLSHAPR